MPDERSISPISGRPSVSRTKWFQDGKVRAWCPDCGWRERAETMSTLNRKINAHVETTGHRVQLYRSQWKAAYASPMVIPEARDA